MRMMKKILLLLTILFALSPIAVQAGNATAFTYTIAPDGSFARSQDAYLPGVMLGRNLGLHNPSDIFIHDMVMFIADTGNRRIVIYDLLDGSYTIIGEELLRMPTGVFVTEDNIIYIADPALEAVLMMDKNGELLHTYSRPTERIFGSTTAFRPRRVAVDRAGGLYIVSEGTFDGIIYLNSYGQFMGYFGFNFTDFSLWDMFRERFYTEAQRAQILTRRPQPFTSLTIDHRGIVHSVTQNVFGNAVKVHDISGNNIIRQPMFDESNFVDVTVGRFGQIYALTSTGLIFVYDGTGNLLYTFGGQSIANERSGFFTNAAAITRDENDCIYVLDGSRGYIYVFLPTPFIYSTYRAIDAYNNGNYIGSRELWTEILRQSGISRIAHDYIALTHLQTQNYEMALHHARIAGNVIVFSDAFWEIRNQWMLDNLLFVILGGVVLLVALKVFKLVGIKIPVKVAIPENMRLLGRALKHPFDTFYDIRRVNKGSVKAAIVIYVIAFLVFAADYLFRGFIFNPLERGFEDLTYALMLFFLPLAIWVVGNYLVGSINEGEGRFRDVFVATAFCLAPIIFFLPFITLATHIVTFNEVFLITTATGFIWAYAIVLLVIALKEIHDYTFSQVFKSILFTLFFMAICVIVFSIISTFWGGLADFVYTVGEELIFRVTN